MMMDNKIQKIIGYVVILLFLITAVHAQFFNPSAIAQGMNNQVTGVRNWYAIEGYVPDEKGNQIPVFNQQYRAARMTIDFFIIVLLIFLAMRSNEQVKKFGKGAPGFIALIVAFSFVVTSKTEFIASFTPFVLYLPYIFITGGIFLGMMRLFGEDAKPGTKLILFLLSIIIVTAILLVMNNYDVLSQFSKIPGVKSSGPGADELRIRVLYGSGITNEQVRLESAKTPLEKAEVFFDLSQERLSEATSLYGNEKYPQAKDAIIKSKEYNQKGLSVLQE